MKRKFEVKFITEVECESVADGLQKTKESFKMFKADVKPFISKRSDSQNSALWLMFTQLASELNEKGLDMRAIIRQDVEISWTPYNINEFMWKPLLKVLTGKNSTTKMSKTGDIELVYTNLNRILIERTGGEICLPPFPSMDLLIDKDEKNL